MFVETSSRAAKTDVLRKSGQTRGKLEPDSNRQAILLIPNP